MTIQIEDCIDVFKVLYGDRYDCMFLLDHSSGHDKNKPDGLTWTNINKGWGGQQAKMRVNDPTYIKDDSYLGPYLNPGVRLNVGDIHHLQFPCDVNHPGPYYMKDNEREAKRKTKISSITPFEKAMSKTQIQK